MSKRIAITGASSEIGLSICDRIITSDDFAVLQCNNNIDKLEEWKRKKDIQCNIIKSDFSDSAQLADFCKNLNNIDILINSAAFIKAELFVNLPDIDIEKMIDVNIKPVIQTCKFVIKDMMLKRKGCIINISSVAAKRGNRGQSVYAGTKGFIESFSTSLAAEYGQKGIRINCVAPGPIGSGNLKELLNLAEDEVKQSITLKRMGRPDDIANMVAFLCSDDASFIHGKCFAVDGGFNRGI